MIVELLEVVIYASVVLGFPVVTNPTEYNDGANYYQGDIKLTAVQKDYRDKQLIGSSQATTRGAISIKRMLWPSRVIYYKLDPSLDSKAINRLQDAFKDWEKHTCLMFRKRTTEKDFINIGLRGGCWSFLGHIGGKQEMSLGGKQMLCMTGSIIHELGHAIGFYHEQSRPDRDDYIKVLYENINGRGLNNFNKESRFIDSLHVPYDYGSIMHYPAKAFSKSVGLSTIVPKDPGASIGQRKELSKLDIRQANLLYKCQGESNKITTTPKPLTTQAPRTPTKRSTPSTNTVKTKKPNTTKPRSTTIPPKTVTPSPKPKTSQVKPSPGPIVTSKIAKESKKITTTPKPLTTQAPRTPTTKRSTPNTNTVKTKKPNTTKPRSTTIPPKTVTPSPKPKTSQVIPYLDPIVTSKAAPPEVNLTARLGCQFENYDRIGLGLGFKVLERQRSLIGCSVSVHWSERTQTQGFYFISDAFCKGKTGRFPHHSNLRLYFLCLGEFGILIPCPGKFVFDPLIEMCRDPEVLTATI